MVFSSLSNFFGRFPVVFMLTIYFLNGVSGIYIANDIKKQKYCVQKTALSSFTSTDLKIHASVLNNALVPTLTCT